MASNIMHLHAGKRIAVFDEIIELDKGKYLEGLLLKPTDPKYKPCIHLQKSVGSPDKLHVVKGGLIIEAERLPEIKAMIDEMYMMAIKFNLV